MVEPLPFVWFQTNTLEISLNIIVLSENLLLKYSSYDPFFQSGINVTAPSPVMEAQ